MNYRLKLLAITPVFTLLSFFPFQCVPDKDAGVFMSFNAGESWQQKVFVAKNQNIASLEVSTLKTDPRDHKVIYLGSQGSGLWKSADGGGVWYQLNDANKVFNRRANVYDVAIDAKDTANIYIGTYQDRYGRLFRSKDSGRSWEEMYVVSRPGYGIFAVEVDPDDPTTIYMGTAEGGLFKSTNYGKSWKLIKWFSNVISDIKINPKNAQIVYVSTFNSGIYKTIDKGETWQSLENKLRGFPEANEVESLVMDRENPDILYAGSSYGLLKTLDGGENWQKIEVIVPPRTLPILAVAISPLDHNQIYYGAGSVMYKSMDGGKSWSLRNLPSKKSIKTLAVDPDDPNVVYVGMKNNNN